MNIMLVIDPSIITIYEIRLIYKVWLLIVEKKINPRSNTERFAINVKLFLRLFSLSCIIIILLCAFESNSGKAQDSYD